MWRSWHTQACVRLSRTSISLFLLLANYSTVLVDVTEQQKEEHAKTSMCDKRDRAITCMSFYFLQENVFKGGWSLEKIFSNKNYCHVFDTRFAVFFPLPSYCVMYRSIRSFNIPPGQPPGHLTFLKIIVQIPPSLGSIQSFFVCHATYKAFFKKIPPIEITTSWQIHWHASSLTLLINIQAAGQSNWPLLSFIIVLNRPDRYCNSL